MKASMDAIVDANRKDLEVMRAIVQNNTVVTTVADQQVGAIASDLSYRKTAEIISYGLVQDSGH